MKIIVSHDVDHIGIRDHMRDLIVPKAVIRSTLELGYGQLSIQEYLRRVSSALGRKWNNLNDMMTFDRECGVPSTFFIGVANGRGLNYSFEEAAACLREIVGQGFDVGVHGIAYDTYEGIRREFETFSTLTGTAGFGIRIHYLKKTEETLSFLRDAGYSFDSSDVSAVHPFRTGNLWEFPLHMMDVRMMCEGKPWQNRSLEQAKETAKRIIDSLSERGVDYFTVLFHDLYFSDSFEAWKEWYVWLVEYLAHNRFGFVNYRKAIEELNEQRGN